MSVTEAQGLIREGKLWLANVWMARDNTQRNTARDNMLQQLNGTFQTANLR